MHCVAVGFQLGEASTRRLKVGKSDYLTPSHLYIPRTTLDVQLISWPCLGYFPRTKSAHTMLMLPTYLWMSRLIVFFDMVPI